MDVLEHGDERAGWRQALSEQRTANEALGRALADAQGEAASLRQQLEGAVDLIEQARDCVTAALNCTAHPWHGSDDARRWLMRASELLGGR